MIFHNTKNQSLHIPVYPKYYNKNIEREKREKKRKNKHGLSGARRPLTHILLHMVKALKALTDDI